MSISKEIRELVRQRAGCAYEFCGVSETDTGGELTLDHYHPHTKGGTDGLENLLYCCTRYNLYKHDYFPSTSSDPGHRRILDIIHLLEYVWKVANAFWGEKHPGREKWVKEQLLLLLESRTEEVIAQWIDLWEANERTNAQKETIDKALTYLNNHREMVDYKSYLAQGLPISTGIVESACGHLVKTRMEKNGMRWSYKRAQAVLDTRAVLKNGDWDDFMEFFIDKEQRRIYPNSPLLRMRA
ncbi:MAG: HNH endonuclease [Saprospiraceae bacterium]|nr:HNH endonuclease [Saprospiraceae bacterium]